MAEEKKTTLEGETYNGTQVIRPGESTIPAYEKICGKCNTKFIYIADAIKHDRDGDYVICPSCGAFISHQETLKTINFIPPKCTSGAKCEDRPSKSGDSITTLEEAVSEQICIAADKHIKRAVDAAGHPGWDWTTQDIADAFIAGAKWKEEQDERVKSKDLEEEDAEMEIKEFVLEFNERAKWGEYPVDIGIPFRYFYNLGKQVQKEQMMTNEEMKCALRMEYEKGVFDTKQQILKDAVEGEIMMNAFHPHEPRITASYPNCPYKFGDKVKIIIVKEEKQ